MSSNRSMSILLLLMLMQVVFSEDASDEDCSAKSASTELLQTSLDLTSHPKKASSSVAPVIPIKDVLPLAWIHVSKCAGTSFVNVLLLLDGVCPDLDLASFQRIAEPPEGSEMVDAGTQVGPAPDWEGKCDVMNLKFAGIQFNDHSGIGEYYEKFVKGHGAILLRQPQQRIISAYHFSQHDWPEMFYGRWAADIDEYAKTVAGCTVKMLTRTGESGDYGYDATVCGSPIVATQEETALAVTRLREGFVYIGLVEEYELSICLLHKMFGGPCKPWELEASSNANLSASFYDETELNGFRDLADGALYDEGKRIFDSNAVKYGANSDSCGECYTQAGYTPSFPEMQRAFQRA